MKVSPQALMIFNLSRLTFFGFGQPGQGPNLPHQNAESAQEGQEGD
jgi:hypothetical protein